MAVPQRPKLRGYVHSAPPVLSDCGRETTYRAVRGGAAALVSRPRTPSLILIAPTAGELQQSAFSYQRSAKHAARLAQARYLFPNP
jgi:hypothetical protein